MIVQTDINNHKLWKMYYFKGKMQLHVLPQKTIITCFYRFIGSTLWNFNLLTVYEILLGCNILFCNDFDPNMN